VGTKLDILPAPDAIIAEPKHSLLHRDIITAARRGLILSVPYSAYSVWCHDILSEAPCDIQVQFKIVFGLMLLLPCLYIGFISTSVLDEFTTTSRVLLKRREGRLLMAIIWALLFMQFSILSVTYTHKFGISWALLVDPAAFSPLRVWIAALGALAGSVIYLPRLRATREWPKTMYRIILKLSVFSLVIFFGSHFVKALLLSAMLLVLVPTFALPIASNIIPKIWAFVLGDHPAFRLRMAEAVPIFLLIPNFVFWHSDMFATHPMPEYWDGSLLPPGTPMVKFLLVRVVYEVAIAIFGIQNGRVIGIIFLRLKGIRIRHLKPWDPNEFDTSPLRKSVVETIIHWSDLHVTRDNATRLMEGKPNKNENLIYLLQKFYGILSQANIILITGDITDTGHPSEWKLFNRALRRLSRQITKKIVLVPGNHDIHIIDPASRWATLDAVGVARNLRRLRYLAAVNRFQGDRTSVINGPPFRAVPFREFLRQRLLGHTHQIKALLRDSDSPEFLALCKDYQFWHLVEDVWVDAFPMHVSVEGAQISTIICDSNEPSANIITNAFGRVSKIQRDRLRGARGLYPNRPLIAALHHHFGRLGRSVPISIYEQAMNRGLTMMETVPLIQSFKAATLGLAFCGHSHFGCIGDIDETTIICAPSTTLGNESADGIARGRATGFGVYEISWTDNGICRIKSEKWIT
jgi:calcineurin-like phosphoesterase family protein